MKGTHWDSMAHFWAQLGSPLRPIAEDQAGYQSFIDPWIERFDCPRIVILGVTPELYHLAWPEKHDLVALDRSRAMIDEIWPGPPECAHEGDWLEMPLPPGSRDLALCDGGPILVKYPKDQQMLVEQLHRLLTPGGRVILRPFVPPPDRESVASVLDDLLQRRIDNLNLLKLRLAMAIQASPEEGVAVQEVLRTVESVGDLKSLAHEIGWSWDHMRVIETYRGAPARYYFASEAEITRLFCEHERFRFLGRWQGTYPLAERCPIVAFERLRSPLEMRA
jgi:SAM-dependent methyltransferase